MNRIDSRDIIDLESRKRDKNMATHLASKLCVAQEEIHRLVELLKRVHAEGMLHPRHELATSISVAIHTHDESWQPKATHIGKDPAKR